MDKYDFIKTYFPTGKEPLIRVAFNYACFLSRDDIFVSEQTLKVSDFMEFYVPWYAKDRECIERIKDSINEAALKSDITLKIKDWKTWLEYSGFQACKESILKIAPTLFSKSFDEPPIPIVTIGESNKTIILDKNHSIIAFLTLHGADSNKDFRVARIEGENLKNLSRDIEVHYLLEA